MSLTNRLTYSLSKFLPQPDNVPMLIAMQFICVVCYVVYHFSKRLTYAQRVVVVLT